MCENVTAPPRIAVSVEIKVSDGAYGSIGGSCHLSGITTDMTGKDIDELLDSAQMTFDLIRERLEPAVEQAKQQRAAIKSNGRV